MSDSNDALDGDDRDDSLFGDDDDDRSSRLFDSVVPEVIKRVVERAVETGFEKLTEGPENLRNKVADLKLPKEAATYLYHHFDDTKKGVYRVVAKEIRDVLEHTNLSDEIADVLTKLQFEITTQIRFVPNTGAQEGDEDEQDDEDDAEGDDETSRKRRINLMPRPSVVSKVAVKSLDRKGKTD